MFSDFDCLVLADFSKTFLQLPNIYEAEDPSSADLKKFRFWLFGVGQFW